MASSWTKEEGSNMLRWREEGKTFSWIGTYLCRDASACEGHYLALERQRHVNLTHAGLRVCLQCRRTFKSPDVRRYQRCARCHHDTDESAGVMMMGMA